MKTGFRRASAGSLRIAAALDNLGENLAVLIDGRSKPEFSSRKSQVILLIAERDVRSAEKICIGSRKRTGIAQPKKVVGETA